MKGNKIFDFSKAGFQDIINIMTRKINECVDVSNGLIPRLDEYISKVDWNKIINSELYQNVLGELGKTNEQLDNIESKKLDKTGIVTMANMGQDIKEAMTGGSVAVVGKNTILTENIIDSQITPEKTTFFDIKIGNNILEPVIYKDGVYINLSGQEIANASYCVSKLIKVKPNTTYYAKGKTGYNPYGVFINEYTGDEIWVKGKQLVTNDNNFTTGSTTAYINVSTVKEFVSVNNYPLSDICISTSSTLAYEPYFKKETINLTNLPILTSSIFGDIKVVGKTGDVEYNSITQAVNESNNGDVILILPGVYEDEKIKAWGKEIHLIGFSRENTVITNSTGTYTTPPIEIGRGSIENLTVHAKYGVSTDSNGWACYAVHSEDNNLKDGKLTIRNCKLISEVNASFGLGMRGGCKIEIIDSDLVGIGTDGRALFFHDASSTSYAGLQEIDIIRCRLISNSTTNVTFRYNDQCVDGSSVKINIENTLIHNEAGSSYRIGTSNTDGGSYSGWRGLKNTTLSSKTYGNSMTL